MIPKRKIGLGTLQAKSGDQAGTIDMHKAILIPAVFLPSILIVMIVNQSFYGGCLKIYCLKAALPKVTFFAAVITAFVVINVKGPRRNPIKAESACGQDDNHASQGKQRPASHNHSKINGHDGRATPPPDAHVTPQLEFSFDNYERAAAISKTIAREHGLTITQKRRGNRHYIEIPRGLTTVNFDVLLPHISMVDPYAEDDDEAFDFDAEYEPSGEAPALTGNRAGNLAHADYSRQKNGYEYEEYDESDDYEAAEELRFELFDNADAYARSNEEGWFYPDTDPGWENNVLDRDRESAF